MTFQPSISKICLTIDFLKFCSNVPGTNGLRNVFLQLMFIRLWHHGHFFTQVNFHFFFKQKCSNMWWDLLHQLLLQMMENISKTINNQEHQIPQNHQHPENLLQGDMSNFAINIVTADGLAPLGARTSAVTVMTKFGSIANMVPVTWRVNSVCMTSWFRRLPVSVWYWMAAVWLTECVIGQYREPVNEFH